MQLTLPTSPTLHKTRLALAIHSNMLPQACIESQHVKNIDTLPARTDQCCHTRSCNQDREGEKKQKHRPMFIFITSDTPKHPHDVRTHTHTHTHESKHIHTYTHTQVQTQTHTNTQMTGSFVMHLDIYALKWCLFQFRDCCSFIYMFPKLKRKLNWED